MKIETVMNFSSDYLDAVFLNDTLNIKRFVDVEFGETPLQINTQDISTIILELQAIHSLMNQTEKKTNQMKPRNTGSLSNENDIKPDSAQMF